MSYFNFGLSKPFDCSYLPNKEERLLVYIDDEPMTAERYAVFQQEGFRRSQDQVYRPHCDDCSECQSVRLRTATFMLSKSQKRIRNKCRHFQLKISTRVEEDYYPLFEKYINQRHFDGVMYPAEPAQLESFAGCEWMQPNYFELWDNDDLIAVSVSDPSSNSLSAVYTFFDPKYSHYSLGTFLVLEQIKYAIETKREWLYLGYFIADCAKMNYKTKFKPYQIRTNGQWHEVTD